MFEIYVDMDGVLCNFLKGISTLTGADITCHADWAKNRDALWQRVHAEGINFWANLEWMPGGKKVVSAVWGQGFRILSAYPTVEQLRPNAIIGKQIWLDNNIGRTFAGKAIICHVVEKQDYAKPGAILIDDNPRTIEQWNAKGGIGILHVDVDATLKELKTHGIRIPL